MKFPNRDAAVQRWLSWLIVALLVWPNTAAAQQPPAAPPVKPMAPLPTVKSLKVINLAGEGEMNDLERRVMAPLVVQVSDQNDRPLEGADVVFRFPLNGPGATFADQKTSKTVRTNSQGQAAATGWTANSEVGRFQVHVTAAYGNQIGETTISMSNVTRITGEAKTYRKHRRWYSSKWVKIGLIAATAGAVAGIVLATTGGSSSSPSHTITISPGSPSVGAPH